MKSKNITIVIPLKGDADALRYELLLKPSLEKINANILLISSEELDGAINDDNFDLSGLLSGWHKQQFLKLIISYHINTPWYLCLDADCFFTSFKDIDSMLLSGDKSKAFYNDETGIHEEWWTKTCNLLGCTIPKKQCGVTPMTLSTQLSRDLCDDLGLEKIKSLINQGATEYTLYWSHHKPYSYYIYRPISHGIYPQPCNKKCFIENINCYRNISKEPWSSYPIGLIQSTMKHHPFKLKAALSHLF